MQLLDDGGGRKRHDTGNGSKRLVNLGTPGSSFYRAPHFAELIAVACPRRATALYKECASTFALQRTKQ